MTDKLEQILEIEPKNKLHFKGPYTKLTADYLTLSNPSDRKVCFRIRTTAPNRYCVRPNNGIINAKNMTVVAFIFKPPSSVDIEQIKEFDKKHKFMIQSTFVPDEEVNQEILWREIDPSAIMESKLECEFDLESIEITENSNNNDLVSLINLICSEDTGQVKSLIDDNCNLRREVALLKQELNQIKEISKKRTTGSQTHDDDIVQSTFIPD